MLSEVVVLCDFSFGLMLLFVGRPSFGRDVFCCFQVLYISWASQVLFPLCAMFCGIMIMMIWDVGIRMSKASICAVRLRRTSQTPIGSGCLEQNT